MGVDLLYKTMVGRGVLKAMEKAKVYRLMAALLHTRASAVMIPYYIKKNQIDMKPYGGQKYKTFAQFFARSQDKVNYVINPDVLISPCDSRLTIYPIDEGMHIPMKGSHYRLTDLIPDENKADAFAGGLCLVFRLEASDYHHFCFVDDGNLLETHYIEGQLHSVQPIACETYPVFRLNRRWWSILDTVNFGMVGQIEIGAMSVGGVTFAKEKGFIHRGEEMGNFELAGSTIVLLFDQDVRKKLEFRRKIQDGINQGREVRVLLGEGIGKLVYEEDATDI